MRIACMAQAHPFYTDEGWQDANALQPGSFLSQQGVMGGSFNPYPYVQNITVNIVDLSGGMALAGPVDCSSIDETATRCYSEFIVHVQPLSLIDV